MIASACVRLVQVRMTMGAAILVALFTGTARGQFIMDDSPVTACSGVFTDSGGIGSSYNDGESFTKVFSTGIAGASLTVRFTEFDIAGGNACSDSLTIFDGPSAGSPLIGVFCNETGSPGTVTSTHASGALTFVFQSDSATNGSGWTAQLSCNGGNHVMNNAPVTTCSCTFTDSGGPGGGIDMGAGEPPGNYSNNESFVKTFFAANPGDGIVFDAFAISLEPSFVCGLDSLKVYNGSSTSAPLIGTVCSTQLIGPFIRFVGQSGALTFEFSSDNFFANAGWFADIECIPASELPTNDHCQNATPISTGAVMAEMRNASADGGDACACQSTALVPDARSVWHEFTAPGDGMLGVLLDSEMTGAIFPGGACPGNLGAELTCGTTSMLHAMSAGETVLLRSSSPCSHQLVTQADRPIVVSFSNADCATAVPVTTGATVGSFEGLNSVASSSCLGSPTDAVWYRFTAPDDGTFEASSRVSTLLSGIQLSPANLALFDACGGNELACSSDATLGDPVSLSLTMSAGEDVFILVTRAVFDLFELDIDFHASIDLCSGDGGNQTGCTDCPCLNNAPQGTTGGCLNSLGTSARLTCFGGTSLSGADLRFEATDVVPMNTCLLTSAQAVAPTVMSNPCFGLESGIPSASFDGVRCAVQGLRRHGTRLADATGCVGVANEGWGEPDEFVGFDAFLAGATRYFQVVYRDDMAVNCMTGLNTSQAIRIGFLP